jgi:hypothetical protein
MTDSMMDDVDDKQPYYTPNSPSYIPVGGPVQDCPPSYLRDHDRRGRDERDRRSRGPGRDDRGNGRDDRGHGRDYHGRDRNNSNRRRPLGRNRSTPYHRGGGEDSNENRMVVDLIRQVGSMTEYNVRRELPNMDVTRVLHRCDDLSFHMEDGDRIWVYCDPNLLEDEIRDAIRHGASSLKDIQLIVKRRFRIIRKVLNHLEKNDSLTRVFEDGETRWCEKN